MKIQKETSEPRRQAQHSGFLMPPGLQARLGQGGAAHPQETGARDGAEEAVNRNAEGAEESPVLRLIQRKTAAIRTATQQKQIQRAAPAMKFKYGSVSLNAKAAADIVSKNVLLDDADQKHLSTAGNLLGYDENYTTPEDPFRWEKVKEFINDSNLLEINGVERSFEISSTIWDESSQQGVQKKVMLANLGGSGVTLANQSLATGTYKKLLDAYKNANNGKLDPAQRGYWSKRFFTVSDDPAKSKIYYESSTGGRGIMGNNSLAHEIFGHYWLVKNGKPDSHREEVQSASDPDKKIQVPSLSSELEVRDGVTDALGGVSKGPVTDYIENNTASKEYDHKSPTWKVGLDFVNEATTWLESSGAAELAGITKSGKITKPFYDNWYILNNNYAMGKLTAGNTSVADLIMKKVMAFYCALDSGAQTTFRRALDKIGDTSSKHPKVLANAVTAKVTATTPDPCAPSPPTPTAPPAGHPAQQAFESRPVGLDGEPVDTTK